MFAVGRNSEMWTVGIIPNFSCNDGETSYRDLGELLRTERAYRTRISAYTSLIQLLVQSFYCSDSTVEPRALRSSSTVMFLYLISSSVTSIIDKLLKPDTPVIRQ
nr:hypothetical protein CFP56_77485 [Quercus suber]